MKEKQREGEGTMKKLTAVILSLLLLLSFAAAAAEGETGADIAMTVEYTDVTAGQLKDEIELTLFRAAIECAGYGYLFDIVDPLNIEDETDKVLLDMELRIVAQVQAKELGVDTLTPESEALVRERVDEIWNRYCEIAMSENGLAFLPAGDYEPSEDPEETLRRYFASFGLTRETLTDHISQEVMEEQLKAVVTAGMENMSDDEIISYYADWILGCYDESYITENEEVIAEVMEELGFVPSPETAE